MLPLQCRARPQCRAAAKGCLQHMPPPAHGIQQHFGPRPAHLCSLSLVARLSNGRKLVLVLLRLRSRGRRGSEYSRTNSAASQWP